MNISKKLHARRLLKDRRDTARRCGLPVHSWSETKTFPGIATASTFFISTPLQAGKTFFDQVVKSGTLRMTEMVKATHDACSLCGNPDHYADVCPSRVVFGTPTPFHDPDEGEDMDAQDAIKKVIDNARAEFDRAPHRYASLSNLIAARVMDKIRNSEIPSVAWGPVRDRIVKDMEKRFEDADLWKDVRKWTGQDPSTPEIERVRELLEQHKGMDVMAREIRKRAKSIVDGIDANIGMDE